MSINFEAFAASLLPDAERHVSAWLPGGKRRGREYVIGNLRGDHGDSLCINLETGRWADFAAGDKGGDLLSLYAAIRGIKQLEAARELGADGDAPPPRVNGHHHPAEPAREPVTIDAPPERPPADATFTGRHRRHGEPVATYRYADAEGALFYVCRYEPEEGRKQFSPWRWLGGQWQAKAYPKPRPLYGLDLLQAAKPTKRVMLVEGEKAADALRPVLRTHVVMTWAGGAKAYDTADWAPLVGRNVDFWPDADQPGREAMAAISGRLLAAHDSSELRIIVPEGQPEGWDAADAMALGWTAEQLAAWIVREDRRYLITLQRSAPATVDNAQDAAAPSPHSLPEPAPTTPVEGTVTTSPKLPATDARGERSLWQSMGLEVNVGNGTPPPNEDTVLRAVTFALRDRFWFDTFLQRGMTDWNEPVPRPIQDADFTRLTVWLQRDVRLHKMTLARVKAGLELHLFSNQRNSAQDWLQGLRWDQVARLDFVLERGFGCEPNEYHQAVSRNFLMGMVARILKPGCQVDYMPVFEGNQGARKSTALRVIGGDWFTEATERIDSKDFLQNMKGKLLIEIGELDSMNKAEVTKVKQVITNRVDTYRSSYGRMAGDYPRQCVFAGTTNRDDWVKDDTGARRFWRVLVREIDLVWLTQNREQIFAEAVARYQAGEPYWLVPEAEARRLTDDARARDAWTDPVIRYASRSEHVKAEDIMLHGIDLPVRDHSNAALERIRSILRLNGWRSATVRDGGRVTRAWKRPLPETVGEKTPAEDVPAAGESFASVSELGGETF